MKRPELSIIDINVHVGASAYGIDHSSKQCLRFMDRFGIETSVISCFTPPDLSFERANRLVEKIVLDNPSRFKGSVRVDPRFTGHQKILERFLSKKSFVCVSLNPFEQAFKVNDISLVRSTFEIAEKAGSPVLLESGFPLVSLPLQVAEVARVFRKVNFIMTHSGLLLASGQSESDALSAIIENRNVFCDTSQIILSGLGGFIEQVVTSRRNQSSKRVMFGSNSPTGEISVELLRIGKANISENEKCMILSENAKKLFGI